MEMIKNLNEYDQNFDEEKLKKLNLSFFNKNDYKL